MLLLLALALAVPDLPPAPPASPARVIDAPAREYANDLESFGKYVDSKRKTARNADNLPFILEHGAKTKRSILLVHGFTDSPYYVRSLADIFYREGYNVVAVLLPGHGTKPEDLLHIRLGQWQDEVQQGLDAAARLGERVSLGGFSTGGGLILDAMAKNDGRRNLGDAYLFSGAVKIADSRVEPACVAGAMFFKPWKADNPEQVEDNPYRYRKMAVNGVCQVYWLTVLETMRRDALLAELVRDGSGVFAAQSEADTVVSPQAVKDLIDALPGSVARELIWYPKALGVHHNDVPRPETNPSWSELSAKLTAFVRSRP